MLRSRRWVFAATVLLLVAAAGCKKKQVDPFPATNTVAGWEKSSVTRVFAAKDLWKYIDGDSEQYTASGVVSTATSDYKYKGRLEATVDVFTMKDPGGATKVMSSNSQSPDAKPAQLGDAGVTMMQSVYFRKGPYFVRVVAFETTPDAPQALLGLAQAVAAKL